MRNTRIASSGLAGGVGCAVHTPEISERGAKKAFQRGAKILLTFDWAILRPSLSTIVYSALQNTVDAL